MQREGLIWPYGGLPHNADARRPLSDLRTSCSEAVHAGAGRMREAGCRRQSLFWKSVVALCASLL